MEQSENSETVYNIKATVETVPTAVTAVSILLKSLSFILPLLYICDKSIRNRVIIVISAPMMTAAVIAEMISIRFFFRRISVSSLGVQKYWERDIPNQIRAARGGAKKASRNSIRYIVIFLSRGLL